MWLMYGSRKDENMEPYLVSKVFKSNLEELSLEHAFKNYKIFNKDEVAINIKNRVQYYLPRILSIIPFGRTEYCRTIKETVKTAFVSQTEAKRKKIEENRISRLNEDGESKYKSDPDADLSKARKLLPLLKRERAVDYHEWIRVMFCLMNISQKSYEGYELFLEFSSRAENYDEDGCYQAWTSTEFTEGGNKLTLGSLRMWVKEDSPEEYKRLELNHSEHIIERLKYACIYGSHSDYSELFKYLYGEKNIRILNQDPARMKFASWDENRALWVIQKKVVLSRLISTILKPNFDKWNMEQNNKLATCEDSADKDSITGVLKLIKKTCNNLSSTTFLNNIVNYYCSYDIDDSFETKLNSKKDCLPIKNKMAINLKTKEVYERTIDDLFSFELDVEYMPNCDYTQNVLPFFSDICIKDDDLIDYHKRFWGYSMTGEISDRSLHILWGVGRNGKSTLIDLFQKIIGDKYFVSCSEKVIMNRDQSSSTSPELIRLQGARFAVLSETGKEEELNSTRIKSITGGDNIVARGLYQDEIQFKLQATLAMLTNNKPTFDVKDQAMVDRIKLLPFLARFDNTPENRKYIEELMENCLDEFFSWFVDGAFEWYQGKSLQPCKLMAHQMSSYINELDIQGQFMEERIDVISKEAYKLMSKEDKQRCLIKKDALFAMFACYTQEQGIKSKVSKSDFYKGLDKYNIEMIKNTAGIRYYICREKTHRGEAVDDE
jgi:P4 family phage/plasmid primase-like protien